MDNQPVIDLKNLNHYFGKGEGSKQVLFNIDLQINRGEIVLMVQVKLPYLPSLVD